MNYFQSLVEPSIFGDHGYEDGQMAPGLLGNRWAVRHNTVLAHLNAYDRYEKFRKVQNGKVGITLHSIWVEPFSQRPEDVQAAEVAMDIELGFWGESIFGTGNYPETLREALNQRGEKLPEFSKDESLKNSGKSDFFGLNHYTTRVAKACQSENCNKSRLGNYGFEV